MGQVDRMTCPHPQQLAGEEVLEGHFWGWVSFGAGIL